MNIMNGYAGRKRSEESRAGSLFSKLFGLGLFVLVLDVAKDFIGSMASSGFLASIAIPLSAAGLILCLICIPFLMAEWLVSPLGTHDKRIKLYQGSGNLLALAMLTAGWFWRVDSTHHLNDVASLTLSSGGFLAAILFGWTGSQLAAFISKKNIRLGSIYGEVRQRVIETENTLIKRRPEEQTQPAGILMGVSATQITQN